MSRRKKERVSWHPEALTALVLSVASFFAVLLSLDAVAAPLSHLADEDPAAWFVDGSWIVQICLLFGDLLFSWYMNDNQIKWEGLLVSFLRKHGMRLSFLNLGISFHMSIWYMLQTLEMSYLSHTTSFLVVVSPVNHIVAT